MRVRHKRVLLEEWNQLGHRPPKCLQHRRRSRGVPLRHAARVANVSAALALEEHHRAVAARNGGDALHAALLNQIANEGRHSRVGNKHALGVGRVRHVEDARGVLLRLGTCCPGARRGERPVHDAGNRVTDGVVVADEHGHVLSLGSGELARAVNRVDEDSNALVSLGIETRAQLVDLDARGVNHSHKLIRNHQLIDHVGLGFDVYEALILLANNLREFVARQEMLDEEVLHDTVCDREVGGITLQLRNTTVPVLRNFFIKIREHGLHRVARLFGELAKVLERRR
mmetsp:Transcript_16385/g.41776  ORF Transcript_16385/g.41776 Transcript_16385/m.41776 type:complete len:285 (+) Transcript_16385:485-1339(+)